MIYNREIKRFEEIGLNDLKEFFFYGGKESFITKLESDINQYIQEEKTEAQYRLKHIFSVYLLGIICYDSIENIRVAIDNFIKSKIWTRTHESFSKAFEQEQLRKNFLYIWYLTALYHDVGYIYEYKRENDKSIYSKIASGEEKISNHLGQQGSVLGIPDRLKKSINQYFYCRRTSQTFNRGKKGCTDHGFAGGIRLCDELYNYHCNHVNFNVCGKDDRELVHCPLIYHWYNVPTAWAIICHNMWTVFEDDTQVETYKENKLERLIVQRNKSIINYKNHPILFLLDFIDAIEPIKQFCHPGKNVLLLDTLRQIGLVTTNNSLGYVVNNPEQINNTARFLEHLKSKSFKVGVCGSTISFQFK